MGPPPPLRQISLPEKVRTSTPADSSRLVVIGLQGGRRADLDLALVMRKRLQIIGSTLRARSAAEKGLIIDAFQKQFGDELASGAIKPIVHCALPFERAAESHRLLEAGEAFGKIVLTAD